MILAAGLSGGDENGSAGVARCAGRGTSVGNRMPVTSGLSRNARPRMPSTSGNGAAAEEIARDLRPAVRRLHLQVPHAGQQVEDAAQLGADPTFAL